MPPRRDQQRPDSPRHERRAPRLRRRRRELPEREALRGCHARATSLDGEHATLQEQRAALGVSERSLSGEVAAVAAKSKEVEVTLYSGSVRVPKELSSLQEEIRLLRAKQSELEGREMELLEEIERLDGELRANRASRTGSDAEAAALEAAIARTEAEIDAELALLGRQRGEKTPGLPASVLAEYDRLRAREQLAGRAAAPLTAGACGGCHVRLPVIEFSRLKAQPEDALLCCVRCGRILVR